MKRTEATSKIPNWLAALPKNANITTREFAIALGVSGRTLARRDTPKPDWLSGRTYRRKAPSRPIPYWKAMTVRNYIRKLIASEQQKGDE